MAPQYIVGELLKAEGFSDIKYVKMTMAGVSKALASGEVDVSMHFVGAADHPSWTPATPSRSWAACTSDVSSCSGRTGFA